LNNGTLFSRFVKAEKKAALLNAYPPRYFDGIDTGKRIYSSIPMAVTNAGIELFKQEDLLRARLVGGFYRRRLAGHAWNSRFACERPYCHGLPASGWTQTCLACERL
jgi:hypothetical protein